VIRFPTLLAIAACTLMTGCASSAGRTETAITISERPWFGVCSGVCPDYDLVVAADGQVSSTVRRQARTSRFRVSREALKEFEAILEPLRPPGTQIQGQCIHNVSEDDAVFVIPDVTEIDIRWNDGTQTDRLVACDGPQISETIRQALWSIGLYLTGRKIGDDD